MIEPFVNGSHAIYRQEVKGNTIFQRCCGSNTYSNDVNRIHKRISLSCHDALLCMR